MKNLAPINEAADKVTKSYVDIQDQTKVDRIDMRTIDRLTKGTGGFNVTITNAIQGVAYDGTHYYVTTKTHLYKYNSAGSLVTSRANSGDANTHKYLGDMVAVGGKLYVASSNFDTVGGPYTAYAVEFNTSDLTYVSEHQVSSNERCDSITYHDSHFWMPIYDKTIRQYDASWNFVAEYDMPIGAWEVDTSTNGVGFDGATWVGNYLVLNPHEGIYPDCAYVLYFNGTTFERIAQPDRPAFCTQGVDYNAATGQIIAAERAATPRVTLMNIRTEIPARNDFKELRRTTLTSEADSLTLLDIPPRRYLQITAVCINSGQLNVNLRFNNDTGNNYANLRLSANTTGTVSGGAAVSASSIALSQATANTSRTYSLDIVNFSSLEKSAKIQETDLGTAGAANVPTIRFVAGKWANTSTQITRVDIINVGTGNFAVGSEAIVYGHD